MISIDDTIISELLTDINFVCDLNVCKGECCIEGDAGAPLEEEEISILEDILDEVKPYMIKEGIKVVEKNGVFDYDTDGEFVTPLVNDNECAYIRFDDGIAKCAIEKAWEENKIDFQKPISCHLFPVRLNKLKGFQAVNYFSWNVCDCAVENGNKLGVPVYEFLKVPLIRKFGEAWYQQLEDAIADSEDDTNNNIF